MKRTWLLFFIVVCFLALNLTSCKTADTTKQEEPSTSSNVTNQSSDTNTKTPAISSVSINGGSKNRIYIYKYKNANLDNYKDWEFENASHKKHFDAYKGQGYFASYNTYAPNATIQTSLYSFFNGDVYPKLINSDPQYAGTWISDAYVNITIDSIVAEFGISLEDVGDSYIVTYHTIDGQRNNQFMLTAEDIVTTQLNKTCVQVTKENVLIYYDTDGKKAPLSQCDRCKHISLNTNTNECSVCISMSCNCGGPISEHNCNDYPNVVCSNCGWGVFVTGVGIDGITCPECGTRCL